MHQFTTLQVVLRQRQVFEQRQRFVVATKSGKSAPFKRICSRGMSFVQRVSASRNGAIGQTERRKHGPAVQLGRRTLTVLLEQHITVTAANRNGTHPVPQSQCLIKERLSAAIIGFSRCQQGKKRSGIIVVAAIHERRECGTQGVRQL